MIKRHYSGEQRRALNMIWNAAGRYDFDPPFMAFFPNGRPDGYFNMMIGLVDKWLDTEKIEKFFESYDGARDRDEYDDLLWLGLENCLYEKEIGERPILKMLRAERGERFFKTQQTLSRQQMMLQSMLVYNQQETRWARATGRKPPVLGPREKKMAQALLFPGSLDVDGVISAMKDFLREFFRFDVEKEAARVHGPKEVKGAAAKLLGLVMKKETRRVDVLMVRTGTGTGDREGSVQLRHNIGEVHNSEKAEEDLSYIKACFGKSIYNGHDLRALENDLCKDNDEGCRLWFTKGEPDPASAGTKTAVETAAAAKKQYEKNLAYYKHQAGLVGSSIRRLSAQLDTIFSSFAQPLPETSKHGTLSPEKAYRLAVLDDPYVFTHPGDEVENDVSVDILLDASASRMNSQETISSQAYIIAKSLVKCHVPVEVLAFRSLRSYTVLQVLKEYKEEDCSGIFHYFAGGWNRDGLALKAAESQMEQNRHGRRILMILTDASPNDSTRMPPEQGSVFMREYEGAAAVEDTADAVKKIRADGVRVAAVFLGATTNLENVHIIYGKEFVRIQKIEQLAVAISNLLTMTLREMRN